MVYRTQKASSLQKKANGVRRVANVANYNPLLNDRSEKSERKGANREVIGNRGEFATGGQKATAEEGLPGAKNGREKLSAKGHKARLVPVNEYGIPIGEHHPNAKLTDEEVESIRQEFEAHPVGHPEHVGYRALAHKWGVGKRTIRDIVNMNRRNQYAARWKRVDK